MCPTLGTLIDLLVRRPDEARRRLQGWRRGAQGSGVGRSRVWLQRYCASTFRFCPGLDAVDVISLRAGSAG